MIQLQSTDWMDTTTKLLLLVCVSFLPYLDPLIQNVLQFNPACLSGISCNSLASCFHHMFDRGKLQCSAVRR